jgi:protein subunit release factor B
MNIDNTAHSEGSEPKEEKTRFATDSEIIQYLRKQLVIQNNKSREVEQSLRDQLAAKEKEIDRYKSMFKSDYAVISFKTLEEKDNDLAAERKKNEDLEKRQSQKPF